jgi:hypothetical protein
MNDELDKLFKAGRSAKRDTSRLEFGFEARLLARIRAERQQPMPWFAWAWRLAPVFLAIVAALGVWNYSASNAGPADLRTALTGNSDESILVSYFTGETQ